MWPHMAFVIILILSYYAQTERLAQFTIAATVSLSMVYIITIFVPSYGAYVQHGMSPDVHPGFTVQFSDFEPAYDALRAGVVDVYADHVPAGAISFPSFHTTTVLLYIWAAWRTPARWFVCIQQAACFLAIPVQGAHFVSDMIAGGAIGFMALAGSRSLIGIFVRPDAESKLMPEVRDNLLRKDTVSERLRERSL
jgi:PAP2 superfamily